MCVLHQAEGTGTLQGVSKEQKGVTRAPTVACLQPRRVVVYTLHLRPPPGRGNYTLQGVSKERKRGKKTGRRMHKAQ